MSATKRTVYTAFGLRLASDIPLPELQAAADAEEAADADVAIAAADPDRLWEELAGCGGNFMRSGSRFLFLIPETAIYCIEDGRTVEVAPLAGADPERVRVYLLGTCMGALLMMRGLLPLHGSAVVIDGRAYAFLGESGAGKSTLAAALVGRGHLLLSDDVIAVTLAEDGTPLVLPSYPQQKLWQESIDGLGMASGQYRTIYRETSKYAVPAHSRFCAEPVPLAGIFELEKTDAADPGVARLPNLQRLRVMLLHTYRNMLIRRLGLERWHFTVATGVANRIELYQAKRPTAGFAVERLASVITRTVKGA